MCKKNKVPWKQTWGTCTDTGVAQERMSEGVGSCQAGKRKNMYHEHEHGDRTVHSEPGEAEALDTAESSSII